MTSSARRGRGKLDAAARLALRREALAAVAGRPEGLSGTGAASRAAEESHRAGYGLHVVELDALVRYGDGMATWK